MDRNRTVSLSLLFSVAISAQSVQAQEKAIAFTSPVPEATFSPKFNTFLAATKKTPKNALPYYVYHLGEDWNDVVDQKDYKDPIYAIAAGKVTQIRNLSTKDAWGKIVVIEHSMPYGIKPVYSLYAHLHQVTVAVGATVKLGQPIGTIGDANGYYGQNKAHLHLEVRQHTASKWNNDKGYLPQMAPLTKLVNYLPPSLFIDDHGGGVHEVATVYKGNFWLSDHLLFVSDFAPANLSYLRLPNGEITSLPYAATRGWINGTVYTKESGSNSLIPHSIYGLIFEPGIDYRFQTRKNCEFGLVIPGHNFQAERAKLDLFWVAYAEEFTEVDLDSFTEVETDFGSGYDFRSMKFYSYGAWETELLHATDWWNPLNRYWAIYDSDKNLIIGDWKVMDPNTLY
ncbi:MAG: M23 family metallopeptidase [Candidatus Vogelbacteria bacterium]|nr:M23 family metallopeptidase [Candidatus Vogelbacteria bacterium]